MSIINEFPAYYKGITNDVGIDATVANFTGLSDGVVKCTSGTLSGASTTTDLPEGVNQYYTSVRATADARAALSAGTGISYNSSTGVITNSGVTSITGSTNQVSASASTGAVVLTLPQSIATTSPVRFGSVAVGTTSSYPLHIASGNGYMLCDLSSTYAAEYVGVNSGGAELRVYGDASGNAHIGTITNHDLAFRTNDVNKMWLSKDGYLGIGVSPTVGVYLDVYSNMYLRDANAGFKIATSLGTNYIESAGAGMTGSADLKFTDMNAVNTWMTIKSTGKVGIGTASPATAVHVQTSGTTTNQILTIENAVTSSAGQPTVLTKKSRGTISAPTTVINGDTIGAFTVQGHDGSNYISAASISAQADSTVGTNSMPTALVFRTTPSGGVSTVENMRISSAGLVGIGESSPDLKLVSRNTASAAQISARYNGTAPADYKELQIGYNGTTGNGYGWLQAIANGVAYTPLVMNLNGGYVCLGNTSLTSSTAKLQITGNIEHAWDSVFHYVRYQPAPTSYYGGWDWDANNRDLNLVAVGADGDPSIYFKTGYSAMERMRITGTGAIGMGAAPVSTGGYPTRLDIHNGGPGAALKIQDSAGSGRGHMQFGSSATAANNVHIGCEGDGNFYVWNGTFGGGSQKFQVASTGNFRADNNAGYNTSALYGVGGSYLTLFNTNPGGYSSQIGHDGTNMWINTGAGGNMYLQTHAAGYTALAGRMMLDQAGRLSFNSMTANATLNLFGTASAPLAGICLGGYGYDATPYHRLELANGAGAYQYYMSQNIVWSSANNRWEFVSPGGWGGYGSMLDFYGNGNVQFRTATNVAGLPSFKTNLDMTNDGKCAMAYGLTVSGYNTIPYSCVAEVYNSGSATQALVTTGAKLSIFDSIGINKNATPSAASDNITITVAGTYQVTFRGGVLFAALSGGIGILALAIQRNGTSVASSVQYISNHETNSTVMAVTQCLVDCAVNDVLTIFGGSTPNQTITFSNPYLSVTRVGTA